jgi:hypothetical protein
MIKFLSPDGVLHLLPISVTKNLPMLKPSGRTVPLAELAAVDTALLDERRTMKDGYG